MKLKAGAADVDAEAAKAGGGLEPGGVPIARFFCFSGKDFVGFFGFSYFFPNMIVDSFIYLKVKIDGTGTKR